MTKTEAQELIAEIKTAAQKECFSGGDLTYAQVVEKIINRFANKPPYEFEGLYGKTKLYRHNLEDEFHLSCSDKYVVTMSFNKEQLKQLRDNINSMLEWLQDE